MISDYLPDDEYKPLNPKPGLQQYDNYQIYDMYCIDINYRRIETDGSKQKAEDVPKKRLCWLAVQSYSPSIINCDFNAIVKNYP
jgi:hypothetical protein